MTDRESVYMPDNIKKDREDLFKAVDEFAGLMKEKLDEKRRGGLRGWDDSSYEQGLRKKLAYHCMDVLMGDPYHHMPGHQESYVAAQAIDVANLAMFLYFLNKKAEPGIAKGASDE